MPKNSDKCGSMHLKTQYDVLKCLVLATAQRYSVYCHRGGKKPENIPI